MGAEGLHKQGVEERKKKLQKSLSSWELRDSVTMELLNGGGS